MAELEQLIKRAKKKSKDLDKKIMETRAMFVDFKIAVDAICRDYEKNYLTKKSN